MIEITRHLARRFSAVLRRTFPKPLNPNRPMIELSAGEDGLQMRAWDSEIAVCFHQSQPRPRARLVLPPAALAAVCGSDQNAVTFASSDADQVIARWHDHGIPRVTAFAVPDIVTMPAFPEEPDQWVSNPAELRAALAEASKTTATDSIRYALQRVQLRGKAGQVVGTDGKQLFVASSIDYGFDDDLLVPRLLAWSMPDFGAAEIVQIGRTESQFGVRLGEWTFLLTIDSGGRFPDVNAVIPKRTTSTCRFDRQDAEFLLAALPRLPGKERLNPATLDLNGQVCVRARAPHQPQTTELLLARSSYSGQPMRLNLNRDHLLRALQLGFRELRVVDPNRPIVCIDGSRTYVTMPLTASDALAATADSFRIDSGNFQTPLKIFQPKSEKHMTPSNHNETAPATAPRLRRASRTAANGRVNLVSLIAEAQRIKETSRDLFGRANRLAIALKKHRAQARITASTLRSLKQLHVIEA